MRGCSLACSGFRHGAADDHANVGAGPQGGPTPCPPVLSNELGASAGFANPLCQHQRAVPSAEVAVDIDLLAQHRGEWRVDPSAARKDELGKAHVRALLRMAGPNIV